MTRRGGARRIGARLALALLAAVVLAAGCAKYNTFYNAQKAFDDAERVREDRRKAGEDITKPAANQKTSYETAFKKAQKILDEYPGHGLTDDALFLQGKAAHRLNNYLTSIQKLDLLFTNFPQTPYLEEALYLQGVNFLLSGEAQRSQDTLDQLAKQYPDSRFQAQALRASGDNAYAVERWSEARDAYRVYLEQHPDVDDADDIGLRLATAHWELDEYAAAADAARVVAEKTASTERSFNARLMLARSLTRSEALDEAEELVARLRQDAEIFSKQGHVAIAEAEILVARDKEDDAVALLESMPQEWGVRDVKAVATDMLGYLYLKRGDLETARDNFQQAVPGGNLLEDLDESKRLLKTIQDYTAAENALPDAPPERAARLRLLQANALLFGFERPRQALDIYAAVAADTAADSTVAARALYGAMVVHRDRLADPDSGQVYADLLVARYPESAQAYEVSAGDEADLLAFLLERKAEAVAAGTEVAAVADAEGSGQGSASGDPQSLLRRRKVYLQRRPDLVYPPPERALEKLRAGGDRELARPAAEPAGAPPAQPMQGPELPPPPTEGNEPAPADTTGASGG